MRQESSLVAHSPRRKRLLESRGFGVYFFSDGEREKERDWKRVNRRVH